MPVVWRPAAKQFMREAACKVNADKVQVFVFPPCDEFRGENETRKGKYRMS